MTSITAPEHRGDRSSRFASARTSSRRSVRRSSLARATSTTSATHSLIGAVFLAEELWVVVAYLIRRPARVVSQRPVDWLLAFGGTFGGVLLRPTGAHPHWGWSRD